MSAEKGWIIEPQPTRYQREHGIEAWIEGHLLKGHHPYPAPTKENPEQWECKCYPDRADVVSVWRILTAEQSRHKWACMFGAARTTKFCAVLAALAAVVLSAGIAHADDQGPWQPDGPNGPTGGIQQYPSVSQTVPLACGMHFSIDKGT